MFKRKTLTPFHLFFKGAASRKAAAVDRVINTNGNTVTSGDSGNAVVVCGVQRAADAVGRQRVPVLSQDPTDNADHYISVLLPQQTVDERVAGGLGVGETFGGDAPVARDVHGGQQLHQPAGGQQEKS